ncbi:hypothetical protein PG997_002269 [Apiospora hydei]|uniref:Uncharacterized protein n=1 Tax=Apiospora hydei TaxID=1337664 RepID=A0ABR1X956_9PEZI
MRRPNIRPRIQQQPNNLAAPELHSQLRGGLDHWTYGRSDSAKSQGAPSTSSAAAVAASPRSTVTARVRVSVARFVVLG